MDYGRGGNDGVLLCQSGEHIRTAQWLASPHHSTLSHSHQHYHPYYTISMSFSDASCFDNALDMIYGESSTIPSSHGKASAHTPASRPQGRQTPKPPRTSSSLIRQSLPPSPSTSTVTSFAGEIASSLILFLLRSVVRLRARPFATIDSRTSICKTLYMLGR